MKKCKIPHKCEECKIPLKGWRHKLIAKPIFKIERDEKFAHLCNKCGKEYKNIKTNK